MSFLNLFLIGILIGTAMIIPGVSGGVLAVIFGVYDKIINSLTNLFKDFKKNFNFLFILGIGILLGAIWFSKIMVFLYDRHEVVTKFAFIGLILGGVPYLFKEVKDKTKESIDYRVMIITLVISLTLWIISNNVIKIDLDGAYNSYIISFLSLFLAGFIYSVGKVVPGISGAFLLIMIGMYEYILSIISNPLLITLNDIIKLIPFVLGFISGIIILLKLMSNLLNKHFKMFYSVIIGFVIGSVPALIPTSFLSINLIYGLLIMVFCFVLSYKLSK